ncbi:MAG TPA: lipopolysaccharide kinase InaA family protein [Candidatus Acidoferrum sp.]|nr:lipopolysaccharide kinase InaA family protein [Candidatus Acidoferrum sp.]
MTPEFAPLLDAVISSPGAVIKQSPAKLVTRHDTARGVFFVKRYRHDHATLRPLKFFFKESQAHQEWRLASALSKQGVPIVEHVALGERWSARGLLESILITRAFDGVPLDEATNFDLSRVVTFVKRLVEARFIHRDFHPANLLVNPATGEIRLVDLHGMKSARKLTPERIEDELLAQLCITMKLPVADEVIGYGQFKRRRALAARGRRCLKTNRDFAMKRFGALRWHVRLNTLTPAIEKLLRSPDKFFASAKVLKAGRSSTVGAANGIVLKRFNFRRWMRPLKDVFRESRARAAFRKAYHLELCGIPTARVIAAADERIAGFVRRGFVVMEEIPGAKELPRLTGDDRQAARLVGQLIARLHDEGFSHRDLKETNIVFDREVSPRLIDLEGLRFLREVPDEIAGANLRRLAEGAAACGKLNRRTALAFLFAYCRVRGIYPSRLFPSR